MIRTYDDALIRIAERTVDNYKQLRKDKTQRRVSFVDLYGVEYLRQGDASHPATFYVSISPDFMYYERFAMKLQIMPFMSSVNSISIGGATIASTSLSISGGSSAAEVIDGTSTGTIGGSGGSISPNPHTHALSGGSGGVNYGLNFITTTSTNWTIRIGGVDISAYLREQQGGQWISGEGIYPTKDLEDMSDYYDILDVACLKNEEGQTSDVNKLLTPEMKKVEIISDQPFQVATMVYLKYSHMNR